MEDLTPVEVSPTSYMEFLLARRLREHVVCYWRRSAGLLESVARVLPDGCVDVIWENEASPRIAGPATEALISRLEAGGEIVGCAIAAGGGTPVARRECRRTAGSAGAVRDVWSNARSLPGKR